MVRGFRLTDALCAIALFGVASMGSSAWAGPIFITGHDPDFHSQEGSAGAERLLETGLNYVTGGTWDTSGHKFLWVESDNPVLGGHVVGETALTSVLGLTAGVNFDQVDAAQLATVDFSQYSAIVIASDFGGMLSSAEINELIARSADIKNFVNGGGGLMALAECTGGFVNCDGSLDIPTPSLFGFLPVTATSVNEAPPFTLTAFGQSLGAPFGLTTNDLQDPTHNSFDPIVGLNDVDLDANGNPTTLAGNVDIGQGGFSTTPEPASLAALSTALAGFGYARRRKKRG